MALHIQVQKRWRCLLISRRQGTGVRLHGMPAASLQQDSMTLHAQHPESVLMLYSHACQGSAPVALGSQKPFHCFTPTISSRSMWDSRITCCYPSSRSEHCTCELWRRYHQWQYLTFLRTCERTKIKTLVLASTACQRDPRLRVPSSKRRSHHLHAYASRLLWQVDAALAVTRSCLRLCLQCIQRVICLVEGVWCPARMVPGRRQLRSAHASHPD